MTQSPFLKVGSIDFPSMRLMSNALKTNPDVKTPRSVKSMGKIFFKRSINVKPENKTADIKDIEYYTANHPG